MKLSEKQGIFCQSLEVIAKLDASEKIDYYLCHERGLIPGPDESEDTFLKRMLSVSSHKKMAIPPFQISPDWVCVKVEKRGLPFWEGACTWIEETPLKPRSCWIQLKASSFFGLYSQEEFLAHELVHATRFMFDEPRFEEILAFRTSSHPFRRYFGPLFTRPSETLVFIGLVGLSWLAYITCLFLDVEQWANYVLCLPLLGLSLCLFKLGRSQFLFSAALKKMTGLVPTQSQALTAMLYLTDTEIKLFAISSEEAILHYISRQKATSLRWKQLCSTVHIFRAA